MTAMFFDSLSLFTYNPVKFSDYTGDHQLRLRRKKAFVQCQVEKKVMRSTNVSTVSSHNAAALMENGAKELAPYGGQVNSLATMHDKSIGIVKFLRGKVFFVTGATGFLAKILIEKILRIEPDVDKIFLLIKAKGRENAMERLQNEIMNTELFAYLRKIYGESYESFMLSKLVPVLGNVCEYNLGLKENLHTLIAKEVDVIVHSAAITTFDERYDVAIDVNIQGPCHLIDFAKKCKNLKLYLHVSTAYVNGQRQGQIMEKQFSFGDNIAKENSISETDASRFLPILDVENEIELTLNVKKTFNGSEMVEKMKQLGIERARKYGWQDTYVFTKAMGEMMIDKIRGDVPVVIVRPSVIESTYKDPFPGWIEGNSLLPRRMVDPIILYYGKGQITSFLMDPNAVLDVVPADMVVNATLAAIAKHGAAPEPDINIYQIGSSVVNPLAFKDLMQLCYEHYMSNPWLDPKGKPISVPIMKFYDSMDEFSKHLWEDTMQRIGSTALASSGGKLSQKLESRCSRSVEQIKQFANIYEPYTFYGGRFDNSNTHALMESMSEEEKEKFGFDVKSVDWRDYITNVHIPGLRRHVMKGRGT